MTNVPAIFSGLVPDGASGSGMLLVFLFLCAAAIGLLTVFGPRQAVLGFLRLGLSCFSAPFVFLWKSTGEVARYGREADGDLRKSDQYLLGHVYLYVLGTGVTVAILWAAFTLTAFTFSILPPSGSAQALSEAQSSMQAAAAAAETADRELAEQKTAGPQRVAAEHERAKTEATKALRASGAAFAAARGRIESRGSLNLDAVDGLESRLNEKSGWSGGIEAVRNEAAESFSGSSDLAEQDRSDLLQWLDAWAARARDRAALAAVNETPATERAARLQAEAEEKASSAKRELDAARQEVARSEAVRKPRWSEAFARLASGFGLLILGAWLFGLFAESCALLLRLAGDVRRIRESMSPPAPHAKESEIGRPSSLPAPESAEAASPLGLASVE